MVVKSILRVNITQYVRLVLIFSMFLITYSKAFSDLIFLSGFTPFQSLIFAPVFTNFTLDTDNLRLELDNLLSTESP